MAKPSRKKQIKHTQAEAQRRKVRAGLIYEFLISDPAQPTLVVFHIKPDEIGVRGGSVGVVGQERYPFTQFVWP